jgi:hypothetical protein
MHSSPVVTCRRPQKVATLDATRSVLPDGRRRPQEQQIVNYMFLSSLTGVVWSDARVAPPPLALLGLPYYVAHVAGQHGMRGMSSGMWESCLAKWATKWAAYEPQQDEEELADTVPPLPTLKAAMEAYLVECEGEQGEETKWRTALLKQGAKTKAKIEQLKEQLVEEMRAETKAKEELMLQTRAEMAAKIEEVKAAQAEIKVMMQQLLSQSQWALA